MNPVYGNALAALVNILAFVLTGDVLLFSLAVISSICLIYCCRMEIEKQERALKNWIKWREQKGLAH